MHNICCGYLVGAKLWIFLFFILLPSMMDSCKSERDPLVHEIVTEDEEPPARPDTNERWGWVVVGA